MLCNFLELKHLSQPSVKAVSLATKELGFPSNPR